MPSIRNIALSVGFTTLLSLATATPVPVPAPAIVSSCLASPISTPVSATPTLPLSGDATELPTTNLTLTLQYVAIGRGIQNYTCTGAGSVATTDGALATLFDATFLAYSDINFLHSIPPIAVYAPVPTTTLNLAGVRLPILGHHFFDASLVPTFDLDTVGRILYASKIGDIKAPATASKGPDGTGAVDWLDLTKKEVAPYIGASVDLSQVYRVVTAGGAATNCTEAGIITVPYAAEYWFYN